MEKTDQFERYQGEKPVFFRQIEELEKKHNTTLISKMKARRYDWDSFVGIMAEMDFGLFLDTFCDRLEYEPNIDEQTPDWLIAINGKQALVEVARLKDTLQVDQQTKEDQDAGVTRFHTLTMRPERVFGNTVSPKLKTYGDLVKLRQLPFIIGIYNRHLSGAHSEDAGVLFHSSVIEDRLANDQNTPVEKKDAFLEKLNLARSLVSGILWLDQPAFNPISLKPYEKVFEFWGNERALHPFPATTVLQAVAGRLRY
jgi:hypothetical protein